MALEKGVHMVCDAYSVVRSSINLYRTADNKRRRCETARGSADADGTPLVWKDLL